jgi:hypothetical protein
MIAKNIKGKSFKGCVSYVMNDTAELLEAEGVLADTTKAILSGGDSLEIIINLSPT